MPAPICSSSDFKFDSLNGFTEDTQYLGNVSSTAWVYSGIPKQYTDGSDQVVLMTLPPGNSSGTLLATSAYVWYGKVSATLKTSHTQGVVTAFILLSDVKDEIDFEFVGYNTSQAQSNFYWEGVTNCMSLHVFYYLANSSKIPMVGITLSTTLTTSIIPTRLTGIRIPLHGPLTTMLFAPFIERIPTIQRQIHGRFPKPQLVCSSLCGQQDPPKTHQALLLGPEVQSIGMLPMFKMPDTSTQW